MSLENHNDLTGSEDDSMIDLKQAYKQNEGRDLVNTSFHEPQYTENPSTENKPEVQRSVSPREMIEYNDSSREIVPHLGIWRQKENIDFKSFVEIYQEQIDLRVASSNNPTIVMELDLDGNIKHISPNWEQIVGTKIKKIVNKPISNIIIGNNEDDRLVFNNAMKQMILEDTSYKVKFITAMNDGFDDTTNPRILIHSPKNSLSLNLDADVAPELALQTKEDEIYALSDLASTVSSKLSNNGDLIELEAQGILIQDLVTKLPTHSIWTVRPFIPITLNLKFPETLINLLGFGAEILEGYLINLQNMGIIDEDSVPPPKTIICRICEQPIPAWFIERHSEICVAEHRTTEDLQACHDAISTQRELILKISESLWNLQQQGYNSGEQDIYSYSNTLLSGLSSPSSASLSLTNSGIVTEYKSLPLPLLSPADSPRMSMQLSKNPTEVQSMLQSKKFPFGIFRRLIELCDEALLMNPVDPNAPDELAFSPGTNEAINYVVNWKSFETSDSAIRAIIEDTQVLVNEKVELISRLFSIVQYSKKILIEVDNGVLGIVRDTVHRIREHRLLQEQKLDVRSRLSDKSSSDMLKYAGSTDSELFVDKSNTIESPQPSRVCSPPRELVADDISEKHDQRVKSYTPKDLLLRGRRSSISSSASPSIYIPASGSSDSKFGESEVIRSFNELDLNRGATIDSSDASPRRHLSPAPYVDKHNFSSFQKNTNSRLESSTPLASQHDMPDLITNLERHSSDDRTTRGSSGSTPLGTSSPYAKSANKPPLSPLLVSLASSGKTVTGNIKDYEIIKAISKGAFGSVFLAKRRLTGEYVSIKCLKKRDMIAKNQVLNVKSERAVMMRQTDSPYVAQLYCSFQSREYLYLVMEYLNGGDCATLLKVLGTLGNDWARRYIAEVIVCIDDIHHRGIIHRDLKPDNLLIDKNGHIKLTDFGLSRIGVVGRQRRTGRKSSTSEQAIEIFRKSLRLPSSQALQLQGSISDSPILDSGHRRDLSESSSNLSYFEFNKSQFQSSAASSPILHNQDPLMPNMTSTRSASIIPTIKALRSGSGTVESPLLRPLLPRTSSETSFSLFDVDTPISPHQGNLAMNSLALYDPSSDNSKELIKFVGTPDYLAPETIEGLGQSEGSDWWSLGCILFEFLFGYTPFHGNTPDQVFENILSGKIDWPPLREEDEKEICPPEAKDLIKRLLTLDPTERLGYNGSEEIINHPYFKNIDWSTLFESEPLFVPSLNNPESTDYFDSRGADLMPFPKDDSDEESKGITLAEQQNLNSSFKNDSRDDYYFGSRRSRDESVSNKSNSSNSAVPIRRDRRTSKLADPSEFGSFYFRNLNVLERANKDVINKLKSEHLEHRSSFSSSSSESTPTSKPRGFSFNSASTSLTAGNSFKRPVSPISQIQNRQDRKPQSDSVHYKHERIGSAVSTSSDDNTDGFRISPIVEPAKLTQKSSLNSLSRQVFRGGEYSPSSSDTEDVRSLALLRIQKRRESIRRQGSSSRTSSFSNVKEIGKRHSSDFVFHVYDVLYCEPISVVRHTVANMMERLGCLVVAVSDGDEFIRRATGQVKFDIIFTAMRLPKIEAPDAVKLIKYTSSINSDTPIIAVTGFAEEAHESAAFDDVLEKPIDSSDLKACLQKHCNKDDEAIESDSDNALRS